MIDRCDGSRRERRNLRIGSLSPLMSDRRLRTSETQLWRRSPGQSGLPSARSGTGATDHRRPRSSPDRWMDLGRLRVELDLPRRGDGYPLNSKWWQA
jgi:hypothetical protein